MSYCDVVVLVRKNVVEYILICIDVLQNFSLCSENIFER